MMSKLTMRILNPGTHVTLWVFNNNIEPANLPKNREKNFDLAMPAFVDELKTRVSPQPAVSQK